MALGAPFHCCRLTHWMPRLAASTPLGLVLERQSSQAKDGFVESKKVSIVFRAELTAGDERAARLSPKTRTPPESALGGGSREPSFGGVRRAFVTRAPFRKFTDAAKPSSRNVVLWDFCDTWRIFKPDHIAGRFSCSNVTIRPRRG